MLTEPNDSKEKDQLHQLNHVKLIKWKKHISATQKCQEQDELKLNNIGEHELSEQHFVKFNNIPAVTKENDRMWVQMIH